MRRSTLGVAWRVTTLLACLSVCLRGKSRFAACCTFDRGRHVAVQIPCLDSVFTSCFGSSHTSGNKNYTAAHRQPSEMSASLRTAHTATTKNGHNPKSKLFTSSAGWDCHLAGGPLLRRGPMAFRQRAVAGEMKYFSLVSPRCVSPEGVSGCIVMSDLP